MCYLNINLCLSLTCASLFVCCGSTAGHNTPNDTDIWIFYWQKREIYQQTGELFIHVQNECQINKLLYPNITVCSICGYTKYLYGDAGSLWRHVGETNLQGSEILSPLMEMICQLWNILYIYYQVVVFFFWLWLVGSSNWSAFSKPRHIYPEVNLLVFAQKYLRRLMNYVHRFYIRKHQAYPKQLSTEEYEGDCIFNAETNPLRDRKRGAL